MTPACAREALSGEEFASEERWDYDQTPPGDEA
jgi:hypothetical protein